MDCFITRYNASGRNAVALEDSIMHKGRPVTAGSKMLENFISPLDATVVSRLLEKETEIAGKTAMDEFGICGLTADKSGEILGAVKAVTEGSAAYALCNDLFGKYRRQAAENGLCYIHPTYGTVSRFGLVPSACSMDQIGVMCKDLSDGFKLLSLIAGNDEKDGAMFPEKRYNYVRADKEITVAVPEGLDNAAVRDFAGNFKNAGITLKYFDVCKQVMYILSCAEICNNISRYDGVKFGRRAQGCKGLNDLYIRTRTEGFSQETKLAAVMGSMVLSREQYELYYYKALKTRRIIKESLRFNGYDIIALPCAISEDPYENLSLYALANLAGLPSVSFSHKGQAIQLVANVKNEDLLLSAWEVSE